MDLILLKPFINGIHEVGGSIPPGSTNIRFTSFVPRAAHWAAFLLQRVAVSTAGKSRHLIA